MKSTIFIFGYNYCLVIFKFNYSIASLKKIQYKIKTKINLLDTKLIKMNQNVTEIGGLLYFLTYISDYLPYTLIEIIGTLIGVTGK